MDTTPLKCEIEIKDLKILYNKLCVDKDTDDMGCTKCPLSNILFEVCKAEVKMRNENHNFKRIIKRDLCFAIWHDKVLTKDRKHYHHNF